MKLRLFFRPSKDNCTQDEGCGKEERSIETRCQEGIGSTGRTSGGAIARVEPIDKLPGKIAPGKYSAYQ